MDTGPKHLVMSLFLPEGRWASGHLAIILPPARAPTPSLGRFSAKSPPSMVSLSESSQPFQPPLPIKPLRVGSQRSGEPRQALAGKASHLPNSKALGREGQELQASFLLWVPLLPNPLGWAPLGSPRGSDAISNLNLLSARLYFQEPFPHEPLTGSSQ